MSEARVECRGCERVVWVEQPVREMPTCALCTASQSLWAYARKWTAGPQDYSISQDPQRPPTTAEFVAELKAHIACYEAAVRGWRVRDE